MTEQQMINAYAREIIEWGCEDRLPTLFDRTLGMQIAKLQDVHQKLWHYGP